MTDPFNEPDAMTPTPEPVMTTPVVTQPPILTKALGSAICGFLSMPTCFCFGIPSIILGAVAIYLGVWVRKHYRGTTASEMANVYSWIGTITGAIGIILGIIFLILLATGTTLSLWHSNTTPSYNNY